MRWPFSPFVTRYSPFARASTAIEALDPQTAYARWAASYPPRPHNRLMEAEQAAVEALLPDLTGLQALDAGCGTGRYLRVLADRGALVTGVDLSAPMLSRARGCADRLVRASVCALPIARQSMDLVVCGLALGDVKDLALAIGELARVLRPGGQLLYSVVHPRGAAEGWSRTFDANGRQCAVAGFWHSEYEHRGACALAGLNIDAWHEPHLGDPRRPVALVVRAQRAWVGTNL